MLENYIIKAWQLQVLFLTFYPITNGVLDILTCSSYNIPRIQKNHELLYKKTLLHHSP